MKSKCGKPSTFMMVFVCLLICCLSQPLDGSTQKEAGYRGAEKILIPHKSWPCGMPEGIPVPEHGVPVFEANLKLDQAYDVGKTMWAKP